MSQAETATDTWARMQKQEAEFDAATEYAKQVRRHARTAVVDDDYPAVRHDYESALRRFITAMIANDRNITITGPI